MFIVINNIETDADFNQNGVTATVMTEDGSQSPKCLASGQCRKNTRNRYEFQYIVIAAKEG